MTFFITIIFILIGLLFFVLIEMFRMVKKHQNDIISLLDKNEEMNERYQHNLVTALKSHTAEEYTGNMVVKDLGTQEIEKPDEIIDLQTLAKDDPLNFDKAIGIK